MPTDSPSTTKSFSIFGKIWGLSLVVVAGVLVYSAFWGGPLQLLLNSPLKDKTKKVNSVKAEVVQQEASPTDETFVEDAEFNSETPILKATRTKADLKLEIISQCSLLTKKLKEVKLPDRYASIELTFHESNLKQNPIFKDLQYCFFEDQTSKYRLEMDIFSSEFGGRAEDQVQVQVSAFDMNTTNKIFETGFQFHMALPLQK